MNFTPVTLFFDPTAKHRIAVAASKEEIVPPTEEPKKHPSQMTLGEHFEAWAAENGVELPADKNSKEYDDLYRQWAEWAFSDMTSKKEKAPLILKSSVTAADKKEEKEEPKKEETKKPKDFNVSFDGSITVKDKSGTVVLTLNANELSPEDIDKIKKNDIQSLAEKFTKIKELGLTVENTDMGGGLPIGDMPPSELTPAPKSEKSLEDLSQDLGKGAKKEEKAKGLNPWASNIIKRIKVKASGELPINEIQKKVIDDLLEKYSQTGYEFSASVDRDGLSGVLIRCIPDDNNAFYVYEDGSFDKIV
jgi:hypothetical protein